MITTKRVTLFIVLLCSSALIAQTQIEPYGFQDIHLGMSVTEFKAAHPASKQTSCIQGIGGKPRNTVVRCDFRKSYANIGLQISTMFVDGKLALIEVQTPFDTPGCFEPPSTAETSALYFYSTLCQQYPHLIRDLTSELGPNPPVIPKNEKNLRVLNWHNDLSVAEFQDHMCGPWDGTDMGWSKAISEILEGSYCGVGDSLSYRQPVMLYLHKELGRKLMMQLAE
jgi:hypothetical protein